MYYPIYYVHIIKKQSDIRSSCIENDVPIGCLWVVEAGVEFSRRWRGDPAGDWSLGGSASWQWMDRVARVVLKEVFSGWLGVAGAVVADGGTALLRACMVGLLATWLSVAGQRACRRCWPRVNGDSLSLIVLVDEATLEWHSSA